MSLFKQIFPTLLPIAIGCVLFAPAYAHGQCSIAAAGSSVTAGGNTLTLTLAITFNPSFTSNRVAYLAARSNTQNSGWQAVGTVGAQ